MRHTLTALFVLIAVSASAQDSLRTQYVAVTLVQQQAFKPNRLTLVIATGENPDTFTGSIITPKGPDGKPLVFDGMVGSFNYMASKGYRFVMVMSQPSGVNAYLFERVCK